MADIAYSKIESSAESTSVHMPALPRTEARGLNSKSDIAFVELMEEPRPTSRHAVSKWGIGLRTPLLMGVFYILACAVATVHLCMFLYLDGKPSDGPGDRIPHQSFVSATSVILSNLFGLALTTSVALVFTQYLWYLLRNHTLKVSTIESMFSMRANPLLALRMDILKTAPFLVIIVVLFWSIHVAASFVPGALVVGPTLRYAVQPLTVPTYNSSFVGNGSGVDTNRFSLDRFTLSSQYRFIPNSRRGLYSLPLGRLAAQAMIVGHPSVMPTPCGGNCSYAITFESPAVKCNTSTSYLTLNTSNFLAMYPGIPAYASELRDPYLEAQEAGDSSYHSGFVPPSTFSASTLLPVGITNPPERGGDTVAMQDNVLYCAAASRNYTVYYKYENNLQSIVAIGQTIREIVNLAAPGGTFDIYWPTFVESSNYTGDLFGDPGSTHLGYGHVNWTSDWVSWYSTSQLMAIFNSMMRLVNGTYLVDFAQVSSATGTLPSSWGLGNDTWGTDLAWIDSIDRFPTNSTADQYERSTVIRYTPFNDYFHNFTADPVMRPIVGNLEESHYDRLSFTMTPELINQALLNITLSMISEIGWWNTTANVTTWTTINTYQFSKPASFFIPYVLSLALVLPVLALGAWVLRDNGVAAQENSFIQFVSTTTGSVALHRAAAGGCLGGKENVPQELKDMKIRYGEMRGFRGDGAIRRAGFGADGEVLPLVKGAMYGV